MLRPDESETADRLLKTSVYCQQQDVSKAVASAKLAHQLLDDIIAHITPGILESEVKQYALNLFKVHGIERTWHPPYVRFGSHTLLTFMDKAKEDKVLRENDIAFIDVGIVKNGIEGDAGRTIAWGDNHVFQEIAAISKNIFDEAIRFWKITNPSGIELYEFIYGLADKMRVKWNLDPAGHLIGTFPHRGWKRGINHFPGKIEGGKWILEIQIRHPELPIGSFFEDLLYHQ